MFSNPAAAIGRGIINLGRRKKTKHDETLFDPEKLIATIRQSSRVKSKRDLEDLPRFRSTLTLSYAIAGNDLSEIAVVDLGNREAVLLVSDQSLGKPLHIGLRNRLGVDGFKLRDERLADVAFIAATNKAINGGAGDNRASDAGPLVDELIRSAIERKASDIHLCCRDKSAMALFRVHSRLYPYLQYETDTAQQVAAFLFTQKADPKTRSCNTFSIELKSMSCMVPFTMNGTHYKLRYKFIRMVNGWDVILRILEVQTPGQASPTFADLGYEVSQIKLLSLCVARSIGLIAFLGPTGSGKSTSLKVSMESDPNRKYRKRYSVEDPAEYIIFLVSQISVQRDDHEEALDSIKALNGTLLDILRGDPDEVMVGEVRDSSTASIVADFVMTGHKLYTSIHASSAFGAILRLARLGLDRHILADRNFLSALAFQRLMPRLCDGCKVPASEVLPGHKLELLKEKFGLNPEAIYCSVESDCEQCNGLGITGSTVVAEIVAPDKEIRRCIAEGEDAQAELYWRRSRRTAYEDPDMTGKTAYEHGLYKISQGWIDPRDLEREFEPLEGYELVEASQ